MSCFASSAIRLVAGLQRVRGDLVGQAPVQQSLPPELQRLIVITFLVLAVIVACTGALVAIVVMMGGTLMGIIGAVGSALPYIGVTFIGLVLAAGWAASKLRGATSKEK